MQDDICVPVVYLIELGVGRLRVKGNGQCRVGHGLKEALRARSRVWQIKATTSSTAFVLA